MPRRTTPGHFLGLPVPVVVAIMVAIVVVVMTSCTAAPSGPPRPAETSKDVAPAPPEDAPGPDPTPARELVGATWRSMTCGERTYGRTIAFATDGTFKAQDLVSPCPPDVDCVWSGIVDREGTYVVADGRITLTDKSETSPAAKPLPATLEIDAKSGGPVEIAPDGTRCAYAP